ncbi:MAG: SPOR domain-containing protein [Bacteroidetes bacterium]|nr:SPOR domain-containing protein [Bacteroidota bacterium]MBU1116018.1 SPOR domain-containing protein [Bacteroidota bacterium]MBU1799214.1 SPOR domain-containing protein [Bacteroidota bacterium]
MKLTLIYMLLFASIAFAQVDIVSVLKQIENGEIAEATSDFRKLANQYPNDPNVQFLDAVLTENGDEALTKYSDVYTKFPKSQFADAALYRVFSYYYSLGIYNKAQQYLSKLEKGYPNSPYIRAADRTLPSEEAFIMSESEEKTIVNIEQKKAAQFEFTVQAGAFLNRTNANNLKKKFEEKGIYSETYTKEIGASLLNVVIIGKFTNESSAKPILDELKKEYNLVGRVIPLN